MLKVKKGSTSEMKKIPVNKKQSPRGDKQNGTLIPS